MIKRLRIKFVCINMAIVTAMMAFVFLLIVVSIRMGMDIRGGNVLHGISENAFRPEPWTDQRTEMRQPYFVVRVNEHGQIMAVDNGFFRSLDENTLAEYTGEAMARKDHSGIMYQERLRYLKTEAALGMTVAFVDVTAELATLDSLLRVCVLVGLLSFGGFLLISIVLSGWAIRPVEKAWNQQRQFVADASHELKTPLTVILTNAELLQSGNYPQEECSRFVSSIQLMGVQMRGLVEGLLELARVDNGAAKMNFTELDLSELVNEGVLPFEPLFFEKNLLLESRVEEGLRVRGCQAHLRQVLDILLDNASKYSTAPGTVTVTLRRQGCRAQLAVASPGEAISREERKRLFERFYRGDKVRTMNHSYGLGLAIARSITEAHGGRIWAESSGGRNTFFVELGISCGQYSK